MILPSRRTSLFISAAALAGVLGCQPNPAAPSIAGAPTTAAASQSAAPAKGPAPARVCAAEEARCVGELEAEVCSPDGQRFERLACGEASICLSGRCVSLRAELPKGAVAVRREDLRRLAAEGWLNGWSIAGPLRGPDVSAALTEWSSLFLSGDAAVRFAPRAACGPLGSAPVHERLKKLEGTETMVLAGFLVAPSTSKAKIMAGFGGGLRVFLNGSPALEAVRSAASRPFKDEIIAEAELRAGVNPIVIAAERSSEAAANLWIRVRGSDGRPIPDLRFAPATPASACGLGELARVDVAPTPVEGGFSIDISVNLVGLMPEALPDMPFTAELTREGKPAEVVAKGTLSSAELTQGKAKVSMPLRPKGVGVYELAFTAGAGGEIRSRSKIVYRGALHERIVDIARRTEALTAGAAPQGSLDSIKYLASKLQRDIADGHPDESWINARAGEAAAVLKGLEAGRDPYRDRTGVVRRAYRSELDGKLQPYVVFIPPSYKPEKATPLIVTFHGLDSQPEHALRSVIGQATKKDEDSGYTGRHLPSFPDYGVILAAPWGYGKAGPRQLGEHDVMRVVEEMRAHYTIDDRRISITGASLGGTVSFVVPLHYPDVFSASAPLCGYPNLMTYQSVRSAPRAPWEETLLLKRYIGNYAENGLYLPLNIVHGGLDGPERSRVIAERYKELGYSYTFDVQDDLDHNVWDYAYEDGQMIAWLKARRRPEAPSRVRLVTGEYRYTKSYWVRMIAMGDDKKLAEIDARWLKKEREARVVTRNVEAFSLDLGAFKVPAGSKIVIDGRAMDLPEGAGKLFFAMVDGGFQRVEEEPSRAGKKRPGVSGPLDDVLRHPVLVVYGTQDPSQIEANKLVAEHASSYDTWAYARFPVKSDSDVTPEDLDKKSLVLIGGPSSNKLTAELIDKLPVRFDPGAITLRGKRYEGSDIGVSLIYPRPGVDGEYVVLHAGVTAAGTLASRHVPQLAPDYLVYNGGITVQRGELLLDKRAALDGGFFDQDWK